MIKLIIYILLAAGLFYSIVCDAQCYDKSIVYVKTKVVIDSGCYRTIRDGYNLLVHKDSIGGAIIESQRLELKQYENLAQVFQKTIDSRDSIILHRDLFIQKMDKDYEKQYQVNLRLNETVDKNKKKTVLYVIISALGSATFTSILTLVLR